MMITASNLTVRSLFSASLLKLSVVPMVMMATSPAIAGCSSAAAPGVDWSECRKRNLIMSGTDISGSNFSSADLSSSDLRESNLSDGNFVKANLVRASLKGANAKGSNFTSVIASRTDFSDGNFEDTSFLKAEISRSNFSNSSLIGSDLSRGEFGRANFSGADISGVNFDFSNLARADFRGAKFSTTPSFANAFLFQTRLEGVDLSQAQGLQTWQIELSCGDDATKLPAGLSKPAGWPCAEE